MTKVIESLIGKHPESSDFFAEWLSCEGLLIPTDNPNKKHRKLSEKETARVKAMEQIAFGIIRHHISNAKLEFLKSKYKVHAYSKYFDKDFIKNHKVIVHFILKGLAKIIAYLEIKRLIDQNIVNEQDIKIATKIYTNRKNL